MIAAGYLKVSRNVRIEARLDRLHPGAINAQRYVVLALTSGCTGMTTDAGVIVDKKAVVHPGKIRRFG